jgi:hypothetical protein
MGGLGTDTHYKLMRLLDPSPGASQRDASRELGVSLGEVNYCLQALIRRGWAKACNQELRGSALRDRAAG